jgi:hypothetical protein
VHLAVDAICSYQSLFNTAFKNVQTGAEKIVLVGTSRFGRRLNAQNPERDSMHCKRLAARVKICLNST